MFKMKKSSATRAFACLLILFMLLAGWAIAENAAAPEAETEPETEAETEATTAFTLLDLDASMVKTGLYAKNEENGVEMVFTMFTNPDDNEDYVSLIFFGDDGSSDVLCGIYDAETETDEDGIDWTKLTFTDVYTGSECLLGCGEKDDKAVFFDQTGTVYEAEYLSADDTINYMATAFALSESGSDDAAESSDGFSLLDVDASMVKTGLYATGENGEEIVLSLFTYDNTDYVSLMMFEADGSNDVICGAYTAEVETDEDGIDWTMMSFDDVYTNNSCKVGCAEPDDGSCFIFDKNANIYEAKYLTADETITYMGAAVAVAAETE